MPLYLFFLNHLGSQDTICESTKQRRKQHISDFKMADEEKGFLLFKNKSIYKVLTILKLTVEQYDQSIILCSFK